MDKIKPMKFDKKKCKICGGRGLKPVKLRRATRYVVCECKREG